MLDLGATEKDFPFYDAISRTWVERCNKFFCVFFALFFAFFSSEFTSETCNYINSVCTLLARACPKLFYNGAIRMIILPTDALTSQCTKTSFAL